MNKKMKKILCKDCRYFEDIETRWTPAPTKENISNKVVVFDGICNNVNNEEYRERCWEYYYCKNGIYKKGMVRK